MALQQKNATVFKEAERAEIYVRSTEVVRQNENHSRRGFKVMLQENSLSHSSLNQVDLLLKQDNIS